MSITNLCIREPCNVLQRDETALSRGRFQSFSSFVSDEAKCAAYNGRKARWGDLASNLSDYLPCRRRSDSASPLRPGVLRFVASAATIAGAERLAFRRLSNAAICRCEHMVLRIRLILVASQTPGIVGGSVSATAWPVAL